MPPQSICPATRTFKLTEIMHHVGTIKQLGRDVNLPPSSPPSPPLFWCVQKTWVPLCSAQSASGFASSPWLPLSHGLDFIKHIFNDFHKSALVVISLSQCLSVNPGHLVLITNHFIRLSAFKSLLSSRLKLLLHIFSFIFSD